MVPLQSSLNTEQTAPYVAYCGCTVTVIAENSGYCGQSGRIRRVFWRPDPWVLVRFQNGDLRALPWGWTDLPQPETSVSAEWHTGSAALLSAAALLDLVRFLHHGEES